MLVKNVVVIAGGERVAAAVLEELPEGAFVIAADSGFDQAQALGLAVGLVVGDLDSIQSVPPHVPIERHRVDKDATDLELALRAAARLEPERIIVVGGEGGRLDHLLANALVLASEDFEGIDLEWVVGTSRVHVVRDGTRLHGYPGELVSLLPLGGPARGVRTEGLRWTLAGDDLEPGTTKGVSNEFVRPVATVSLEEGVLLVIQPEAVQG